MTLCKLGLAMAVWGEPARAQQPDTTHPLTNPDATPVAIATLPENFSFDRVATGEFDQWRQPAGDASEVPAADSAMLTQPWWTASQQVTAQPQAVGSGWELDQLILLAVEHSPLVQSVLIEPQILSAQAVATNGQFDPNAFVESIFKDTSDPVGNVLTTGSLIVCANRARLESSRGVARAVGRSLRYRYSQEPATARRIGDL